MRRTVGRGACLVHCVARAAITTGEKRGDEERTRKRRLSTREMPSLLRPLS